jgi:hypothetical protein
MKIKSKLIIIEELKPKDMKWGGTKMRKFTKILFVLILVQSFLFCQFRGKEWPIYKGDYLGQDPPGFKPKIFVPQIFSRQKPEWVCDCVFSPCRNELYFTVFDQKKKNCQIMCTKRVNNIWTKPEPVPFNSQHNNLNLCISTDGYRIFFKSWRPLPGHTTTEKHSFIWFVHRTKGGWSNPQPVAYDHVFLPAGHPSISYNGNLYFRYRSKDNTGNADTHISRFKNGSYTTPENLGSNFNTEYIEGDVSIAPDESYLVVGCWERPDNNGECDLYVSFHKGDGSWTALKNMGKSINKVHIENNPTITPDGKYLFYMSVEQTGEAPTCSTYWVSTKIIEELRPKNLD